MVGFGKVFFWERQGTRKFRAVSAMVGMEMDICFWNVFSTYSAGCLSWLVNVAIGPDGCFGMGWLPGLRLAGERDPWAASLGLLADGVLEQGLGAYLADDSGLWTPPDFWDAEDLPLRLVTTLCFD